MFSLFIIVILTVINLTRPEINYYLICNANKIASLFCPAKTNAHDSQINIFQNKVVVLILFSSKNS